jgi:hypothetical protein
VRRRSAKNKNQGEVDLAPQAAVQTDAAAKPSIRRYCVLGLLTVIYALNFLDRTIFNVLIEPIKKEFALSDTTMALLAGFGFVLFYSVLGIPIARLGMGREIEAHEQDGEGRLRGEEARSVTTTVGALLFVWAAGSIRGDIQRAS